MLTKPHLKKLKELPPLFHASYSSITVVKEASFAISHRNLLFSFKKSYRNRAVLNSTEKGSHRKASVCQYLSMCFFSLYFKTRNVP